MSAVSAILVSLSQVFVGFRGIQAQKPLKPFFGKVPMNKLMLLNISMVCIIYSPLLWDYC